MNVWPGSILLLRLLHLSYHDELYALTIFAHAGASTNLTWELQRSVIMCLERENEINRCWLPFQECREVVLWRSS